MTPGRSRHICSICKVSELKFYGPPDINLWWCENCETSFKVTVTHKSLLNTHKDLYYQLIHAGWIIEQMVKWHPKIDAMLLISLLLIHVRHVH